MKRSTSMVTLVLALGLALAGCDKGGETETTPPSSTKKKTGKKAATEADAEADKACGDKKGKDAATCLVKLGDTRIKAGKDAAAARVFEAAIRKAPGQLKGWAKLADLLKMVDDYHNAAVVLEQAKCHVTDPPNLYSVRVLLGGIHSQTHRWDDAATEFKEARTLSPGDAGLLFNLGMTYARMKPPKKEQAADMLKGFLARACKKKKRVYEAQCKMASAFVAKIGRGEDTTLSSSRPPAAKPPPAACKKGEVTLPKLAIATGPIKEGDAYTVWGATHHLRSVGLGDQLKAREITIVGHVVATNYADAPACAIFESGEKSTPPDCDAPLPRFYIADEAGEKTAMIPVVGWASTWSIVYDVMLAVDADPEAELTDNFNGLPVPSPLPNVGAKVKVSGRYGFTAIVGTKGATSEPRYGVMTYKKLEYLTKPPTKATLPGKTRK